MMRFLQYFNLIGVLLLAVLCGVQWRINRAVNLAAAALEKTRLEQVAQLAERDRAIKGYVADLEEFRQRLTLAESQLKEFNEKLLAMTQERNGLVAQRDQLVAQRGQLKAAVDKWAAAVSARDAALKQAGEQLQKSVAERNDAVAKFNDLAGKYNAVVKDLNNARSK